MLTKLLHLKHWQLFLLLIGLPMVLQITTASMVVANRNPTAIFIILPVIMIVFIIIFLGWFYALGVNLHKRLPASVTMNLTRFKLFLLIPTIYILCISFYMAFAFNNFAAEEGTRIDTNEGVLHFTGIIIIIHLFSMYCIFYCLYFIAKEFKAVEWQRPVTFGDFAGEFFLIWFFPVGVWFLQPRINKLFASHKQPDAALLSDLQ